jgi:hypothetical protein
MKVFDISELQLPGSGVIVKMQVMMKQRGVRIAVDRDSVGNDKVKYWNELCCETGKA